jgi:hypothetical protein
MSTPPEKKIRLPCSKADTGKGFAVVDLRLKSGEIVRYVLLDENGYAVGRVIGGHSGVDETPFSFEQKDVESFKRRSWAAKFGLAKWKRVA